jgi:hypothetical protein
MFNEKIRVRNTYITWALVPTAGRWHTCRLGRWVQGLGGAAAAHGAGWRRRSTRGRIEGRGWGSTGDLAIEWRTRDDLYSLPSWAELEDIVKVNFVLKGGGGTFASTTVRPGQITGAREPKISTAITRKRIGTSMKKNSPRLQYCS